MLSSSTSVRGPRMTPGARLAQARQSIIPDSDGCLTIRAGRLEARLHLRLFVCPGIHSRCIEYEGRRMITPKELCQMAGKEKQRDWKAGIRIKGKSLRYLMEIEALDFTNHTDNCSRRCQPKPKNEDRLSDWILHESNQREKEVLQHPISFSSRSFDWPFSQPHLSEISSPVPPTLSEGADNLMSYVWQTFPRNQEVIQLPRGTLRAPTILHPPHWNTISRMQEMVPREDQLEVTAETEETSAHFMDMNKQEKEHQGTEAKEDSNINRDLINEMNLYPVKFWDRMRDRKLMSTCMELITRAIRITVQDCLANTRQLNDVTKILEMEQAILQVAERCGVMTKSKKRKLPGDEFEEKFHSEDNQPSKTTTGNIYLEL